MKKRHPLISAIVTTHQRADLLQRALESVVVQSYKNLELIVVDDGSEDETAKVIRQYEKKIKLIYLRNEMALGACAARNKGISAANGEYIAGLDDDDEWHPQRISLLYKNYSPEYSFITSDVKIVRGSTAHIWKKKKVINLNDLLYSNQVGNQVLVKKSRILEVGGFDESLTAAQDYDLWLRLCKAFGPVRNVQKPLQTVYEDPDRLRITTTRSSKIKGYVAFYEKNKKLMTRKQRKYQLYLIRRKVNKPLSLKEFICWVPFNKYFKEMKRLITTYK